MDTQKLVRIIEDILEDEKKLNITQLIAGIISSGSSNNSAGFTTAKSNFDKLVSLLQSESNSYTFSRTELDILEKINGTSYYGVQLINTINEALHLPSYDIVPQLTTFNSERNAFMVKIEKIILDFNALGIEAWRPDMYEIGIVLPVTQDEAGVVSKKMREFELFIKTIQELTGSSNHDVKITRLSNGSLEFFTSQPVEVVMVVTTILSNISTIWDKITSLKNKQLEIENEQIYTQATKKKMKKVVEEEIQSIKGELEDTLPEKIMEFASTDIENGRKNEIRNSVKARIKILTAWFELGIEVDIVPLRIETSDLTEDESVKQNQVLNEIKNTNKLLEKIYELPQEDKKLPFRLGSGQTSESVEENEVSEEIKDEE